MLIPPLLVQSVCWRTRTETASISCRPFSAPLARELPSAVSCTSALDGGGEQWAPSLEAYAVLSSAYRDCEHEGKEAKKSGSEGEGASEAEQRQEANGGN
eukprot:6180988-Pleurochrysis_carterae.AAC.5